MTKSKSNILTKILLALCVMVVLAMPLILVACNEQSEPEKPSVEIYQPFKTEYIIGEELDVTNGILSYKHDGKDEKVEIKATMISAFSTATVGEREMLLTYEDCTVLVPYKVKNPVFVEDNSVFAFKVKEHSDETSGDYYYYLKFYEENKLGFAQRYGKIQEADYTKATYSKSIENFKYVVTATFPSGAPEGGDVTMKITIDSATTIKVKLAGADDSIAETFTKFVEPAFVEENSVFTCATNGMTAYIKFYADNKLGFTQHNKSTVEESDYTKVTYTTAILNSKYVVIATLPKGAPGAAGDSDITMQITVDSATTLKIKAEGADDSTAETFTKI